MNITSNTWNSPGEWITERGARFSDAKIIDAHRFFYMFFSNEDITNYKMRREDPKQVYYGKVIQINLSISKGGNDNIDIVPWFRGSDNSTYMTIGMYIHDVVCEGSITNYGTAKFILNESMVSSTLNDYDLKKSMLNGANVYSKDIRDKEDKKIIISNQITESAPSIPDPRYYTMQQEELYENDIYCLTSLDVVVTHIGQELFDEVTSISIMDVKEMDTLEPIMKSKIYSLRNSMKTSDFNIQMFDSTELSKCTLYHDFMSMQHGYTYIYDTNLGVNVIRNKRSFTPFTKYQFEDKLQYDINNTLSLIKMYARDLENDLGPVRLTFTPLYYGDKVDAYFKDWRIDNQRVLKKQLGIDNGSKIQTEISELVSNSDINDVDCDYPPEGDYFH